MSLHGQPVMHQDAWADPRPMGGMLRRLLGPLVALVLLASAQPSAAAYGSLSDPRDAPDGFDISRVRLRSPGDDLFGKIAFYPVESGYWDFDVRVWFDVRGDGRWDVVARMDWRIDYADFIRAELRRRGRGHVADIRVREDDAEYAIRFRFDEDLLRARRDVRWRVRIDAFDQKDQQGDTDRAPDAGWFG